MNDISKHRSFMMGVSALWIYCFHIVPTGLLDRFPPIATIENFIHVRGFCGVDIFLLLSSFGLYYSLRNNPITSPRAYFAYLKRRFSRILCVLIPVSIVIGLVDHWTILEFLGKTTGIYQLITDVYSYLWFIPCIYLFYIITPFYLQLFNRVKYKLCFTLLCSLAVIIVEYCIRSAVRSDLYAILTRIDVFILGFYLGYVNTLPFSGSRHRITLIISVSALLIGCVYSNQLSAGLTEWYFPALNAQVNLLIAPSLVFLASTFCTFLQRKCSGFIKKTLDRIYSIFVHLGCMSLELYVWHEWLWLKMNNSGTLLFLFGSSRLLMQLATFITTILLAAGTHYISQSVQIRLIYSPIRKNNLHSRKL